MRHPPHQTLLRNEISTTVGPASAVVAPGNMLRHALIIGAPLTSVIYVRFAGKAADGVGLPVYPAGPPLYLTEAHVGNALMDSVNVISPGGVQSFNMIDVFCPCELESGYGK